MKFGSVCSGIEAASVAWHPLGWQAAWLSEIEPFPSAVLAHHYPTVPNLGDMTLLPEKILSGEVEAPDLFCGGTPCQAFSVAGLRNSLDDARGNLSLTFVEIANAIDNRRLDAGLDPAIIFWENVPGVLNTKDNAFGCFLAGLAGEDSPFEIADGKWTSAGCVLGSKRAVAWRTLDAQYFGVAQRRRRVFVVASARDDFDPAAVLFESEGVRRDTAPRREAGESIAGSTKSSPASRCWPASISCTLDTTFGTKQGLEDQHVNAGCPMFVPATANAITASMGSSPIGHNKDENVLAFDAYNQALTENVSKTVASRTDQDTASCIAQPIPIHDQATRHAGKNGEKTMGKGNGLGIGQPGDPMNTLTKGDRHAVAQPIPIDMRNAGRDPGKHDAMNRQGVGVGESGDPAHTVTSAFVHAVAQPISFGAQMSVPQVDFDLNQTLQAKSPMAVAFTTEQTPKFNDDCALTLTKQSPTGGGQVQSVMSAMQVRRLTPVECERLQGFPDNYTNIPWRKKPESPDGPRYKALGNSWAVPVVAWIGRRIEGHLS